MWCDVDGSTPAPVQAAALPVGSDVPWTRLPGEDLRTPYLEDALHWTSVYAELLAFARSLQESATAAAQDTADPHAAGIIRRFDERHACWRARANELDSGCHRDRRRVAVRSERGAGRAR